MLFLAARPVFAYTIPEPTAAFYVNDTADLISMDNENYIIAAGEDLCAKTGAQVVVVTIPSLEGASIEAYATDLFRTYGIGDAEKNNGVLLLLSLAERECRIEVGYGLEGAINDAKAGRIMDTYMIPYFKEDQWDEGIVSGFDAILEEVCKEYDAHMEHHEPRMPAETVASDVPEEPNYWSIVFIGAISLIGGLAIGKLFPERPFIPGLLFLAAVIFFTCKALESGKFLSIFFTFIAYVIGWGITSPDVGSGGGSSSTSSSDSRSSYSSGSSRNSGGGGRSGGGGASRKF